MKFWKVVETLLEISVVILLVSILFVPLPTLSKYGMFLLLSIIVAGIISLIRSAYVFVNEIPARKQAHEQNEPPWALGLSWKTWKGIGSWTVAIILFIILLNYSRGHIGTKECPDILRGNTESDIVVKYFYSPFCPACWTGERTIQNLLDKYPQIRYENFDSRYCTDDMRTAHIRGTPAYQIWNGNTTEITYGVDAEQTEKALCKLGGCSS